MPISFSSVDALIKQLQHAHNLGVTSPALFTECDVEFEQKQWIVIATTGDGVDDTDQQFSVIFRIDIFVTLFLSQHHQKNESAYILKRKVRSGEAGLYHCFADLGRKSSGESY